MTSKCIFKEVIVGFHIVGHTHEDIDEFLGKFSKRLLCMDIYILLDLMKTFMGTQKLMFIPEFV